MILTPEQISELFPHLKEEWFDAFETLPDFGVNTKLRISHFLAQVSHESNDFKAMKENMNYSSEGLRRVFSKYFTPEQAIVYARRPEAIANRVYANRMGNGNERSGDGWKYRGGGPLQLTGKNNYRECSIDLFGDEILLEHPQLLHQPLYGMLSALWFWDKNKLNVLADGNNIDALTRRINGGLNGLDDRKLRFGRFYKLINRYERS